MAVHEAQWKAHSPDSALYHLRQTSLALQQLKCLANNYRIKIEFNQYTQVNFSSTSMRIILFLTVIKFRHERQ